MIRLLEKRRNPNKDNPQTTLTSIKDDNGNLVTDPQEVIQCLTSQAATTLTRSPSVNPLVPFPWANDLPPTPPVAQSMFEGQIDTRRYKKCLSRMANGKAPGHDGIPAELLIALSPIFHSTFTLLF